MLKKKMKKDNTEVLTSPTSEKMMNSFLIKNADTSFDSYYNQMRKKKPHQDQRVEAETSSYGRIRNRKPPARDGHTGIEYNGDLIIFGGDRHHMPFNDTYILNINNEMYH